MTSHAEAAQREGRFFPPPERLYLDPGAWRAVLAGRPRVEVESLEELAGDGPRATSYSTDGLALRGGARVRRPADAGCRAAEGVAAGATAARRGGCGRDASRSHGRSPRGARHRGAPERRRRSRRRSTPLASAPLGLVGELTQGVRLPADGLVVVTEAELFGERRAVRRGRRDPAGGPPLEPGRAQHRRLRRARRPRHRRRTAACDTCRSPGTEGDFLHLEYLGGDRLYVPVDRINVVQRYVSADGAAPALDKLGGTSWERVKAKTKESILAMAHELVRGLRGARGARAARRTQERRPVPGVRGALPVRGDAGPAARDRRGARRPRRRAGRWIGWCAATSASARPRSRCAPRSSPCSRASRWPCSCRRRSSRSSTSRRSAPASRATR